MWEAVREVLEVAEALVATVPLLLRVALRMAVGVRVPEMLLQGEALADAPQPAAPLLAVAATEVLGEVLVVREGEGLALTLGEPL